MRDRRDQGRELGQHLIFGDEEAAQLRSELSALREQLAELGTRVHSQFTTIAAHAEIARQQADFVRDEARAELDRTRDIVIGLIEQVRAERPAPAPLHVPGAAPGPSAAAHRAEMDQAERRLDILESAVHQCFDRQRELADTMAAMLDTVLAGQRGEPVAGLALA